MLEGCTKIGRSRHPDWRLVQLQEGLPVDLYLYHQIETQNSVWLERYLHVAFRHRLKHAEWFRLFREHVLSLRLIQRADSESDIPAWLAALKAWNETPEISRYFYIGLASAYSRQTCHEEQVRRFGPLPPAPPLPVCTPDKPAPKKPKKGKK